jgi:cell cycle checkpoint control protein RAD9A
MQIEVLKHPLRTAVTVNISDFEQINAQERMHIVISVKDFKSIVAHADTLGTLVYAFYSTPGLPLQFSYSKDGLYCQFTLMTVGDYTPTPSAAVTVAPSRISSRAHSITRSDNGRSESNRSFPNEMPPPAIPNARNSVRKLGRKEVNDGPKTAQSDDDDTLFMPAEEEDRRWDPADYENDEEALAWDASANNVSRPGDVTNILRLVKFRMRVSTLRSGTVVLLHVRILLTVAPQTKDCRLLREFLRSKVCSERICAEVSLRGAY